MLASIQSIFYGVYDRLITRRETQRNAFGALVFSSSETSDQTHLTRLLPAAVPTRITMLPSIQHLDIASASLIIEYMRLGTNVK
jgi:hypothetical protein